MLIKTLQSLPHPRLIIAILLGVLSFFYLPSLRYTTAILISWNVSIWTYLSLMALLIMRADKVQVLEIVNQEHERGFTMLLMLSIAALASVAVIVQELAAISQLSKFTQLHYILTFLTIFGSWCFVGVIFTMHYAHMYYRIPTTAHPLKFPQDNAPDYWDFLYFSFTISVAAQTSDVLVLDKDVRKVVLFQSILSFIFNVAIIGLSINIAAGLIS